ncbi:MAG: MFS transporter [Anaerolineae bacterium]
MASLWLARLAPLNIVGLFIAGFGVANLFPLTLATAISVVPQQVDQASARISMGSGIAIFMAPLLLGWVADQLGIQSAYGIVAVLALCAIVVVAATNRVATR